MKKRLIQYLFSFAVAICLLISGGISVSAETAGESDSVKVGDQRDADAHAERVSLKAKLEMMKAKVAGGDTEKPMPQKARGKEETL